jgi:hypothetical protein
MSQPWTVKAVPVGFVGARRALPPPEARRGRWRGGLRFRRATGCRWIGQLAAQETDGQVQLPFAWIVTPQLLPLPLGLAVRVWAFG